MRCLSEKAERLSAVPPRGSSPRFRPAFAARRLRHYAECRRAGGEVCSRPRDGDAEGQTRRVTVRASPSGDTPLRRRGKGRTASRSRERRSTARARSSDSIRRDPRRSGCFQPSEAPRSPVRGIPFTRPLPVAAKPTTVSSGIGNVRRSDCPLICKMQNRGIFALGGRDPNMIQFGSESCPLICKVQIRGLRMDDMKRRVEFFGREDLISQLDNLWAKRVPSLVTCRGRRRVGKSTLIAKADGYFDAIIPFKTLLDLP